MPPQNMPLWHEDYFELKVVKKQQAQEGSLPSSFLPFYKDNFHVQRCLQEIILGLESV